jgi:hypothetical protein
MTNMRGKRWRVEVPGAVWQYPPALSPVAKEEMIAMTSAPMLVLALSLLAPPLGGEWSLSELPSGQDNQAVKTFALRVTHLRQWLDLDPTWTKAVDADARFWTFGDRKVLRIRPFLQAPGGPVVVEGADRIVTFAATRVADLHIAAPLTPTGRFSLTNAEAVAHALAATPASLLRVAQARDARALARPTWLTVDKSVRPAWRVRVPTLRLQDLTDLWIDAETGAVLRRQPAAQSFAGVQP